MLSIVVRIVVLHTDILEHPGVAYEFRQLCDCQLGDDGRNADGPRLCSALSDPPFNL